MRKIGPLPNSISPIGVVCGNGNSPRLTHPSTNLNLTIMIEKRRTRSRAQCSGEVLPQSRNTRPSKSSRSSTTHPSMLGPQSVPRHNSPSKVKSPTTPPTDFKEFAKLRHAAEFENFQWRRRKKSQPNEQTPSTTTSHSHPDQAFQNDHPSIDPLQPLLKEGK